EAFEIFRKKPEIPADAVLRKFYQDRRYLGARDRRFIGDLYFNAIKNWRRLEALVQDCYEDHAITPNRKIAAYLNSIKGNPAEETANVNGVLADRERKTAGLNALPGDERIAIFYSYPTWSVKKLRSEYPNNVESILIALNGNSPLWIRTNTLVT